MSDLTSRLSGLNPFSKGRDDGDDKGGAIVQDSFVGGHSSRRPDDKHQLRVSHALRSYLVHEKVLSESEAGDGPDDMTPALRSLLSKPHIAVPPALLDRSHPLPEYFVSSSHNTYLQAHQLYGTSSASAYDVALRTGSRCVEIDAWDNEDDKDEPKVTHGYTLVSHIPFRAVCETIRDVLDEEIAAAQARQGPTPAPILISLENHCDAAGQMRLAQIMRDVFGPRLLSEAVRQEGHDEQAGSDSPVSLADLGSRIAVIVEYHIVNEGKESESESSDSEDDEDEKAARKNYKAKKKSVPPTVIVPALAALGVYAQSVKPGDNSWFDPGELTDGPHHHLINVSESGLSAHLPAKSQLIARHNSKHLMRVFPKGTRISSSNLKPIVYWGVGAQICALNWQSFGTSNQLNAALFDGSDGYVLKPAALRAGGDGRITTGKKKKLRLSVGGATDIPMSEAEAEKVRPYLTCSLYHPDDLDNTPVKRKTAAYKHHKLSFLHRGENPLPTDPVWDEQLEWEYDDTELAFLRIMIKSDDSFARNPILAVASVRLSYVVPGWTFIRMLDLHGRETKCTLLVKFEGGDGGLFNPSNIIKPGGIANMVQVQ